jgi:hypothetical protein
VPLVDVTYSERISEDALGRLAGLLPDVVAQAVECPEEPWSGPPQPGDIEIRFRRRGAFDVGELDLVVEVRTKFFASRAQNTQERADGLRERFRELALGQVGVWLILAEGAWSQTE